MNAILEQINLMGRAFVEFAGPMLVQSSVLIAILLIGDFVLRRKVRAVFRYWLWMLVLVKLVLPTSLATPVSLGYLFGDELRYVQTDYMPAAASEVHVPQLVEAGPVEAELMEAGPVKISGEVLIPTPAMAEAGPAAVESGAQPVVAVTPVTWEGVLFLAWLAGVIAMGLLLAQRAIFVVGLVAQAKGVNGLMGDTLKYCCSRMGVRSKIGLRVSANATSPAVCGLFRPIILVPQDLGPSLGAGSLRVVLMHELAHIRRGDLWVNLVQTVLQVIYFYNPLLWLANAVIRRVREQAVDEAVQVAMGEKAGQYPETLVSVAKLAFERPALSLRLIGVVESKSTLQDRVKRMLNRPIPKSAKLGFLGLAVILIVGAILLPMAAAREDKEVTAEDGIQNESQFTAQLSDGVTVELVGVCEHPSKDKQWWRPEGSLIGQVPVRNIDVGGGNIRRGEAAYELVAKLTGSETLLSRSSTREKWKIPQARKVGLGKSGTAKDKNGVPCLRATTAIVKNGLEKIDIEFGLAGVWEKQLTISSNESTKQKIQDTGIVINPPYEKNSNATITIKKPNKIDSKMAINITAVLKNGKVIDGAAWNRNSKIRFMRSTDNYEFHGVNLSDVDHFEIYTSKYQWVEFKNVSLKPNFKTAVGVEGEEVVVTAKKFKVYGRITDEDGKPISAVEITAHCGMGTLFKTGSTVSDTNGEYIMTFAPGIFGVDEQTLEQNIILQAATIRPHKPGFYEKNLHRQGDLSMASEIPTKDNAWNADPNEVVLPYKPYRLDFVMTPAATIVGKMFDENGEPVSGQRFGLTGPVIPPSSSVAAGAQTNDSGEFKLEDVPCREFYFVIGHSVRSELKTKPLKFTQPGLYELELCYNKENSEFNCKVVKTPQPIHNPAVGVEGVDEIIQASEFGAPVRSRGRRREELSYDDGSSEGKKSIAGSGHMVLFETPSDGCILRSVRIYGSRYGYPRAPKEDFHIWVCDEDFKVIVDFPFPYSRFTKGNPKWVTLRVKPTAVPSEFVICAGFNPEQTKGVFVHYDDSSSGNSFTGLPGREGSTFNEGEWMMRAVIQKPAEVEAVSAEQGLQDLIDGARAGETVIVPEGVYTEPISIIKPLKLKGQSPRGSVFEVTANEPAIFVDTKGKGKVTIEGVTIKWQLATSDKGIEHPFAVAVKDARAEIKNCNFVPLGNPKRSPVAIRAMGFSNLDIEACRFEGFEYVVCYGEGTEGVMSDSLIMDCGHQGVILYSGAKAKIIRNVITGSKYHAVRSTGGTLDVRDNLIIENANRGIYLGNKSASGVISNNIIMGSGTGISGFARSRVRIQNNIIADSSYAGISMRDSCSLSIRNNILQGNAKGCIVYKEGSKNANKVFRNLFWQNEVDVENFAKPAVSISAEPGFVDPENGDFSLKAGAALEHKQGLSDPNGFKVLWRRWKNRDDKNEPYNVPDTKTDAGVEP